MMKEETYEGLGELVSDTVQATMTMATRFQEKFKELKDNNRKLRVELARFKGAVCSFYTDGSVPAEQTVAALKNLQEYVEEGYPGVDCTECPSAGLSKHLRFDDTSKSCEIYAAFKKGIQRANPRVTDKDMPVPDPDPTRTPEQRSRELSGHGPFLEPSVSDAYTLGWNNCLKSLKLMGHIPSDETCPSISKKGNRCIQKAGHADSEHASPRHQDVWQDEPPARDAVPALSDTRIEQLAGRRIDPAGTISLNEARAMAVEIQARRNAARSKEAQPNAAREELVFITHYLGHQDQDANHAWMVRRIRAVLAGKDPREVAPWQESDGVRQPIPVVWWGNHCHRMGWFLSEDSYNRIPPTTWIHGPAISATDEAIQRVAKDCGYPVIRIERPEMARPARCPNFNVENTSCFLAANHVGDCDFLGVTWRDVLDCKVWFGNINRMAETARNLGYHYFIWNDRLFQLNAKGDGSWTDKGLARDVIKEKK